MTAEVTEFIFCNSVSQQEPLRLYFYSTTG